MRVFKNRAEAEAAGYRVRPATANATRYDDLGRPHSAIVRTDLEAQLAAALEAVQWSGNGADSYTGPLCPTCESNKASGHASDCNLSLALKAFRGVS